MPEATTDTSGAQGATGQAQGATPPAQGAATGAQGAGSETEAVTVESLTAKLAALEKDNRSYRQREAAREAEAKAKQSAKDF